MATINSLANAGLIGGLTFTFLYCPVVSLTVFAKYLPKMKKMITFALKNISDFSGFFLVSQAGFLVTASPPGRRIHLALVYKATRGFEDREIILVNYI